MIIARTSCYVYGEVACCTTFHKAIVSPVSTLDLKAYSMAIFPLQRNKI